MTKAPIAFFAYNRPNHIEKALESLSQCEGAVDSELFIFCDGPKKSLDKEAVEEVRSIAKRKQWCGKVHVIERDENMGLANSVISGVTEVVNRYGRVIVVEDDLILSPQFLNYMNDALDFYRDNAKVMHVSGYMFPVKDKLPPTFFYRNTSCWGWATWKRSWDMFDSDSSHLLKCIKERNLCREFDLEGTASFVEMLQSHTKGKLDSWAVRWYGSVFLRGGLCLHPGLSLVKNTGHDGSGIHCVFTDEFNVELSNKRIRQFVDEIEEDKRVIELMVGFYKSLNKPLFLRVVNKLRHFLT